MEPVSVDSRPPAGSLTYANDELAGVLAAAVAGLSVHLRLHSKERAALSDSCTQRRLEPTSRPAASGAADLRGRAPLTCTASLQ